MECRERLRGDDLAITHEFLGQMLGVRRAWVTETIAKLQERGLIRAGRKRVQVADAAGLEAAACECYRLLRDEYDRLLGPMLRPPSLGRKTIGR